MVVLRGFNPHHRCSGKFGCKVSNPGMNFSLKFPMNFAASLSWCMFGGTSWGSILLLHK